MEERLALCRKIIDFSQTEEIDLFAEKQLRKALVEYKSMKKTPLAEIRYIVNGKKFTSLLEAMLEFEELETLEIHFFKPKMSENWDYNVPTKKLVLLGHGLGGVQVFDYDPYSLKKWDGSQSMKKEKVMIRGFITQFYYPQSIKSKTAGIDQGEVRLFVPALKTLEMVWKDVRESGVLPIQLHISAFTPDNRYNYELDLTNDTVLKDFRGGVVPLRSRAERESIDYFNFDKILASTDMRDLVKKVFITLFDMNDITPIDIALSFKITDTMAKNSLDALVTRGLADKEGYPPREIFEINSNNLKSGQDTKDIFI